MRIAMRPDLVAGLRDLTHLLGKRLDRMARNEPGSFDLVAFVQAQQPWGAHLAGEKAARNIKRRILAAVGAEPARDRVDIDAEAAENLFIRGSAHGYLLTRRIARGQPGWLRLSVASNSRATCPFLYQRATGVASRNHKQHGRFRK